MGFKRKKTIYKLVFEDPDLDGFEVRAYAPPLGFIEVATKMVTLGGRHTDDLSPEEVEVFNGFFAEFAKYLVSWNLEDDDDRPIPATLEGLCTQDVGFVFQIIDAWMSAVGDVAGPLGQSSNVGQQSLVASLPMAPLSPSQQSWSGPSLSSAAVSGSGAFPAS